MVFIDVVGVLNDGGMYYREKGDELKKFSVRDGTGAILLKQAGIRIGAITGEKTQLVYRRVRKLEFDFLYFGVQDKSLVLDRILEEESLHSSEVAYIGDEINDLCLLGKVGFFMTVLDGNPVLRKKADCVLKLRGGEGALREAATLILQAKGCYETTLEEYLIRQRKLEEQVPILQKFLCFDNGKENDPELTPE